MTRWWPAIAAPVGLGLLLALGIWEPAPRPIYGDPAWPSLIHPLGVDELGRDDNLSLDARVIMQNLARSFVENCFNRAFASFPPPPCTPKLPFLSYLCPLPPFICSFFLIPCCMCILLTQR